LLSDLFPDMEKPDGDPFEGIKNFFGIKDEEPAPEPAAEDEAPEDEAPKEEE
jgi:hypothetical protein